MKKSISVVLVFVITFTVLMFADCGGVQNLASPEQSPDAQPARLQTWSDVLSKSRLRLKK